MKTSNNVSRFFKTPILSILLLVSASISQAHAGLIFNLSSDDILIGDSFSIDVIFDNPNQLTLESFAFNINDEALQAVSFDGDSLMNPDFMDFAFGLILISLSMLLHL